MPYKKFVEFGEVQAIFRVLDEAWIPLNLSNTDYYNFLQYLSDNDLTLDDIPLWSA